MSTLIPRKVLFDNPKRSWLQVSPNGEFVSWLAARDGVMNIWVAPKSNLDSAKPVTKDTGRGVQGFGWALNNTDIIYSVDPTGDENWQVWRTNQDSDDGECLLKREGAVCDVMAFSRHFPNELLVILNDRNPQFFDVYRLDVTNGKFTLVEQNDEFSYFVEDRYLNLQFAAKALEDGSKDIYQRTADGGWEKYDHVPLDDVMTTHIDRHDDTGNIFYMRDSRNRNTAALFEVNKATGEKSLIAEDDRVDIGRIFTDPITGYIQGYVVDYEREAIVSLDPDFDRHLTNIKNNAPGAIQIIQRTPDDRYWVIEYMADTIPTVAYVYDTQNETFSEGLSYRPELDSTPLATMHSTTIQARDGLNLVVYYTLPLEADPNRTGKPYQPVPMVMMPHGGPWWRDSWGFDSFHQWLANRGYGVMCVNFRSSTGYGKDHINKGDLKWGEDVIWDQIDAVNWAIGEGIAQKDKVAVLGGSFGGYSTLASLTMYPEVYCCGVDIVGPSNLITLLNSVPEYWKPELNRMLAKIGDFRTEEGRALLEKHSPLTHVENIRVPLLIGQGANDPRVKQAEADQIVTAMTQKGLPVTYAVFPDEGHGFAKPENRLSFNATIEAFLAQHLGGRFEPAGDDFKGSSMMVPNGKDDVPGLADALQTC